MTTILNTFQKQIAEYGVGGGGGTGGAGPQGPTGPGPDIPIPSNTDLTDPVAIGTDAGAVSQSLGAVAIGLYAGNSNQAGSAVAVGTSAGSTDQQLGAVAIGGNAGSDTQGLVAVAVGFTTAEQGQQGGAVAIGNEAGRYVQGDSAIAIGNETARTTQGERAIAIGKLAGEVAQGIQGIAIGSEAGRFNQGMDSIAIGTSAGLTNQAANSIIVNASGTTLDAATTGFFVHPIQEVAGPKSLYYDASTKEITYHDLAVGPQGAEGFQGLQGFEGLQGFDGTQGFQGVQGEVGFQGLQGIEGTQGFQGFAGTNGSSSSFFPYRADTTILYPGDPATGHFVWDTAGQTDATFLKFSHRDQDTFDIEVLLALVEPGGTLIIQDATTSSRFQKFITTGPPVVVPDDTVSYPVIIDSFGGGLFIDNEQCLFIISNVIAGPQGPIGFQGVQGLEGLQGLQGIDGTQGFQGDIGFQGFGLQGVQGVQGLASDIPGPIGPPGDQGFQGVQGIEGIQGMQGDIGFQGFGLQGLQGLPGPAGATGGIAVLSSITTPQVSFDDGGQKLVRTVALSTLDLQDIGDYIEMVDSGLVSCFDAGLLTVQLKYFVRLFENPPFNETYVMMTPYATITNFSNDEVRIAPYKAIVRLTKVSATTLRISSSFQLAQTAIVPTVTESFQNITPLSYVDTGMQEVTFTDINNCSLQILASEDPVNAETAHKLQSRITTITKMGAVAAGAVGPQGVAGDTGPSGGPVGPQGIEGSQGYQGELGFQGIQGDIGVGVQGPEGVTGPEGGPPGPQGLQGPTGGGGGGGSGILSYGGLATFTAPSSGDPNISYDFVSYTVTPPTVGTIYRWYGTGWAKPDTDAWNLQFNFVVGDNYGAQFIYNVDAGGLEGPSNETFEYRATWVGLSDNTESIVGQLSVQFISSQNIEGGSYPSPSQVPTVRADRSFQSFSQQIGLNYDVGPLVIKIEVEMNAAGSGQTNQLFRRYHYLERV